MGFWDAVVGAGKSAKNALEERAKQTYLERWDKLKSASEDRINDFYLQHNKADSNNAPARGLAIAAMAYQSVWNANSLWCEDKHAANFLKNSDGILYLLSLIQQKNYGE